MPTPGRYVRLLALVTLLAGCSAGTLRPDTGNGSSLQHWVDTELAPYVTGQFSRHPRFKGEPVILVRLQGDDIQPDIDGLTRGVRDRVMDSLLTAPGVVVPWQPQQRQAEHHRRLDQLQCGKRRDASYYIGIEVTRTPNDRFRVSMRVLDVRAGEWVSGFTRQWTGDLTAGELRALQQRRTDESLRGLRILPFANGQSDLAATYLANNLSCLLRQQDAEDLLIKVESTATDPDGLHTLLGLIGNNLSRYREVQITDDRRQANYILRGELHTIQPELQQAWVILQPRGSGLHLSGMDTATYMRSTVAAQPGTGRHSAGSAMRAAPVITRMELVRRTTGDSISADCRLQSRDCPVLEVDTEATSEVFVIAHGIKHGMSRLSGRCEQASTGTSLPDRHVYRFPEADFRSTDWPTLYAVAASGGSTTRQLRALLEQLPDACSGPTGVAIDATGQSDWLQRLDHVIATHPDQVVWMARRIP